MNTDSLLGNLVLFLDERLQLNISILNLAFVLAKNNPNKMIVFHAAHYFVIFLFKIK